MLTTIATILGTIAVAILAGIMYILAVAVEFIVPILVIALGIVLAKMILRKGGGKA